MKKFEIVYKNGNLVMDIETRRHTTNELPSKKMVSNALHTLCVKHGIHQFENASAIIYCDGKDLMEVKIYENDHTKPVAFKAQPFYVESFFKTSKYILAYCERSNLRITVTITLDDYIRWCFLNRKFVPLNYWELSSCCEDIYEYITTQPIMYQGKVISNGFESISNAFKTYEDAQAHN